MDNKRINLTCRSKHPINYTMNILFSVLYTLFVLIFIMADIKKKILNYCIISILLLFIVNNAFLYFSVTSTLLLSNDLPFGVVGYTTFIIVFLYTWCRMQLYPCKIDPDVSRTVGIIYGGRQLLILFLWLIVIQLFISLNYNFINRIFQLERDIFLYNNIIAFVSIILTFLNGWFRIFIFSTRLWIVRRILVSTLIWIPVINIFIILYMCKIASIEYDHACNKAYKVKCIDSRVCETKYPLLLLHGVGFRDFKYLNYWGRIPKYLIKNGATVYYGHQEAFGTIKDNAQMIKDKIGEIITEIGCEKVNIIAHSKGGLDARYTITTLGMGEYVASLTTISTPHRGSALAEFFNKHIPDKHYHSIARFFDKRFLKIGDKNPDFYTAMHQFTKEYVEQFNKENPNVEGVYYQSYMSLMKNCFSHSLLAIPYLIMCLSDKKNDGLVTLESSQWGEFRGVYTNKKFRGISHGDMIDITRGDCRNFDVIETYINIVSDLKNKGF